MLFWYITLGTFLLHELVWSSLNLFYIICDRYHLLQQYRLARLSDKVITYESGIFYAMLKRHLILLPILALASSALEWWGFHWLGLPSTSQVICSLIVFGLIDETLFYWIHRLFHVPWFYQRIHYIHHEYDTNETSIFSLVGDHSHIFENIFNDLFPLMAGPLLWAWFYGLDLRLFWFWIFLRKLRSTDAHSNYQLPYHPLALLGPLYGGARQHLVHHTLKGRRCNFGGLSLWDRAMGTYVEANP